MSPENLQYLDFKGCLMTEINKIIKFVIMIYFDIKIISCKNQKMNEKFIF